MKEQGYKREEVAEMLGISPLSVKKNLQVAMRSVRANMLANMNMHAILLAAWGIAELAVY